MGAPRARTEGRSRRGDVMSPAKRSALMSRIRGKDTLPERLVAEALAELGLDWEGHAKDLPGRPDFVFRSSMVTLFVDGDFWHGWRFPVWKGNLSEAWERKIGQNRERDIRNHRRLRRLGWRVVRVWEHQIHRDLPKVIDRILQAIQAARGGKGAGR